MAKKTQKPGSAKDEALLAWKMVLVKLNGLPKPYPDRIARALAKALTDTLHERWSKARTRILMLGYELPGK